MSQTDEAAAAVRGSQGYRSNERDAPENSDTVGAPQASAPRDAEIDRHDVLLHAVIHTFLANARLRREIEDALRLGPSAVFDLLDEVAYEQDLDGAMAMIEGVADFPITDPVVLRQTLGDAMTLIEGVRKAFEDGLLRRRRR